MQTIVKVKVAVGLWTWKMNYEGWKTKANELNSYFEPLGPHKAHCLKITFAYLAQWIALPSASKKVEKLTLGDSFFSYSFKMANTFFAELVIQNCILSTVGPNFQFLISPSIVAQN